MPQDLIARLRARKTATAWTRGMDTDYPTAWAPDPDCQDAATALEAQAAEIARLQGQRGVLLDLLGEAAHVIHNLPDEAETQAEADVISDLKDRIADARVALILELTS